MIEPLTKTTKLKVSVTLPRTVVQDLDTLIAEGDFVNRSIAVEQALRTLLRQRMDARILAELENLDRAQEIADAEEGMREYSRLVSES